MVWTMTMQHGTPAPHDHLERVCAGLPRIHALRLRRSFKRRQSLRRYPALDTLPPRLRRHVPVKQHRREGGRLGIAELRRAEVLIADGQGELGGIGPLGDAAFDGRAGAVQPQMISRRQLGLDERGGERQEGLGPGTTPRARPMHKGDEDRGIQHDPGGCVRLSIVRYRGSW